MSVWIKGEDWSGREGKFGKDFQREYTRVFIAYTDNPAIGAATVAAALAASSFAVYRGAAMPGDAYARCYDIHPTNFSDDPLMWRITAQYSTTLDTYQADPTLRPTLYTWSTEFVERAEAADLDDVIIQNSAYETFEPPASSTQSIDVIKAVCTRASFIRSRDKDPYIQRVNSVGFTIDGSVYRPGQVLLADLEVDMVEELGTYYRRFSYTFKGRRDLYTTSTTAINGDYLAGDNTILLLDSISGIAVGDEIVIDEGTDEETCLVEALGVGSVTVDLTKDHSDNAPVVLRKYNPWQYMPLDAGFMEWDEDANQFVDAMTRGGQPVQHPILLNGEGVRLDTWSIPPEAPVRLLFRLRDSANFGAITLP